MHLQETQTYKNGAVLKNDARYFFNNYTFPYK